MSSACCFRQSLLRLAALSTLLCSTGALQVQTLLSGSHAQRHCRFASCGMSMCELPPRKTLASAWCLARSLTRRRTGTLDGLTGERVA